MAGSALIALTLGTKAPGFGECLAPKGKLRKPTLFLIYINSTSFVWEQMLVS